MTDDRLDGLLERRSLNAIGAWLLTALVAFAAIGNLLDGDVLRAGFTAGVVVLVAVPPLAYRNLTVMLPWEVLLLAALPVFGWAVASYPPAERAASYLSVAALALVVAVELDVFTRVRMPNWFAVLFVVIATLATAGAWAVVQWLSDVYLGTDFLVSYPATEAELARAHESVMWDFVAATGVGVFAGVIFEWYFRRQTRGRERLPEEIREAVE